MLRRALLLAALAALAAPAAAHATATVTRAGDVITVTGTAADESVTALQDGATVVLTGAVTPGAGCVPGINEVRCGTATGASVRMVLGDGDDTAAGRRLFVFCLFGSCPPTRESLSIPLEVDAGPGDDTILDGNGDDALGGGPGRDTFLPVAGADDISGGSGIDLVNYTLSSSGVIVTLDDVAGDGPNGIDNVHSDVEDVTGTAGDDTLVGDADANQLAGGAGSDKLVGGGGFDALYGEGGVDNLQARDGNPERVDCGGDNDFATVDTLDHLSGCESVEASAALQADLDHDGFAAPADCDDHDPAVRPGALDWPDNGIDENCDGADATIRDRDHDGVLAPADCNDADPAVRPGAVEVFGDAVDQNCNGRADPLQTIESTVQSAFQTGTRTTRVRRLRISHVQGGTIVRIECPRSHRRRACRRAVTTVAVDRDTRSLDLRKRLGLRTIRPHAGTRLVVWLLRPDSLSRRVSLHFRARRTPSTADRCAQPGSRRLRACPSAQID